ncbi:hypothetical protein ACNPM8_01075 [Glutamicibacter sp. AGC46]
MSRSWLSVFGAVLAAVRLLDVVDSVAQNGATAVRAPFGHGVDGAFETVEAARAPVPAEREHRFTCIAADIAGLHGFPPELGWVYRWLAIPVVFGILVIRRIVEVGIGSLDRSHSIPGLLLALSCGFPGISWQVLVVGLPQRPEILNQVLVGILESVGSMRNGIFGFVDESHGHSPHVAFPGSLPTTSYRLHKYMINQLLPESTVRICKDAGNG